MVSRDGTEHTTLLNQGFTQVPSLVSASLCADILTNVSMAKGEVISNAVQQEVHGELRARIDHELRRSPMLAALVRQVFGVATFRVSEAKRLSIPCHAEPQTPHADDYHNRSLIGVVHLRDGQQPTEALPYDAAARYPTGVFVACGDCGAYVQVGDMGQRHPEPEPDPSPRPKPRPKPRPEMDPSPSL